MCMRDLLINALQSEHMASSLSLCFLSFINSVIDEVSNSWDFIISALYLNIPCLFKLQNILFFSGLGNIMADLTSSSFLWHLCRCFVKEIEALNRIDMVF